MLHKTDFISLGPEMHHCASIAKSDDGYWVCLYHGQECRDTQRVAVCYREKDDNRPYTATVDLEPKTGNPIVWSFNNQIYMMYSYFTDATIDGKPIELASPVERWKYCTNHLAKLSYVNGTIKVEKLGEIEGAYGLLARCQPLIEEDRVLLPLYREKDPICQIWEFTDNGLLFLSEFGAVSDNVQKLMHDNGMVMGMLGNGVAIQPSIIKNGEKYLAFCRNVCRPTSKQYDSRFMAWIASSEDGKNWSDIHFSGIPNHNNSLVATSRDDNDDFIVFNTNRYRSEMILYGIKSRTKLQLNHELKKKASFSYPNIMWDDGALHVMLTNCGVIAWHYLDEKYMQEAF